MEYPDLGVFMCPICMELLTITDNTEAFMVIGPACCRTVIFLLSTNVSAVDFLSHFEMFGRISPDP